MEADQTHQLYNSCLQSTVYFLFAPSPRFASVTQQEFSLYNFNVSLLSLPPHLRVQLLLAAPHKTQARPQPPPPIFLYVSHKESSLNESPRCESVI